MREAVLGGAYLLLVICEGREPTKCDALAPNKSALGVVLSADPEMRPIARLQPETDPAAQTTKSRTEWARWASPLLGL